jgi:phosphoribosylformylglycinamidine cyclo-ligase
MEWLANVGDVAELEMLKTFNCGVGMVLAVAADQLNGIEAELDQNGMQPIRIGSVEPVPGVHYSGNLSF